MHLIALHTHKHISYQILFLKKYISWIKLVKLKYSTYVGDCLKLIRFKRTLP